MSDIQEPTPPAFTVEPYPLYNGEPLEGLRGRKASEFPSPLTYPPPKGECEEQTKCGCLYTVWSDDVRLETIWQPLWDFRPVVQGLAELRFFQDMSQEKQIEGKCSIMPESGQMTWPKRMHVWEIEFHITSCHPGRDGAFKALALDEANVRFTIGEKAHLTVPFHLFQKRCTPIWREERLFFPLPLPLYLAPVQNFRITVFWNNQGEFGKLAAQDGAMRCVLGGYLSREIP